VITSFREPKTVGKAIKSVLAQKTKHLFSVLVSAPDKETLDVARKFKKEHKNVEVFKDAGKGKSFALNQIFKNVSCDILILSDGDVHIAPGAVDEVLKPFSNPEVGCVAARPVPLEGRRTKYGFWANFLFDAAHEMRSNSHKKKSFLECSGYLFAFRKKYIKKIPLDIAEDTIIPHYMSRVGFRVAYAPKAKVFVKNVQNWRDWLDQKVRTAKLMMLCLYMLICQGIRRKNHFLMRPVGVLLR